MAINAVARDLDLPVSGSPVHAVTRLALAVVALLATLGLGSGALDAANGSAAASGGSLRVASVVVDEVLNTDRPVATVTNRVVDRRRAARRGVARLARSRATSRWARVGDQPAPSSATSQPPPGRAPPR